MRLNFISKHLILWAICVAMAMPATAFAKPTVFKLATLAPAKSAWMRVFKAAAKEIRKRTNGEVIVRIYGGGRRGDEKVVVRKMKSDK